jgi:hypothetical protein
MLAHCHRTGTRIQLRENGSNANANRANYRAHHVANVMEASLYDRSPVRTVITPDAMRELLLTCHSDAINKCCPITQAEFAEGDAVLVLPCGHAFFKDAIQTWLETESAECPVCRHALPSHEVIITSVVDPVADAAVADADADE